MQNKAYKSCLTWLLLHLVMVKNSTRTFTFTLPPKQVLESAPNVPNLPKPQKMWGSLTCTLL